MEAIYTVEQVAEILSVSPKTVEKWLRQGMLKGFKAGKVWRIKESDLEAFIQT